MEISNLKALVAVAETGSFSRAAENLFITQPAISKRVAALEAELDVQLFDRIGRQIRLTEAGETMLSSARRILSEIATSREEVRSLSDDISGQLRLATSHHIGIHRLPPILKAFTQAYPKVDLDLLFMDSEKACELVAEGSIELAIVTLPDGADESLLTRVIWEDPLAIVCSPDHDLANIDKPTVKSLGQFSAVLPARGTVTRSILFNALSPHGINVNTTLETNYLETIKMMVSVGLGWSALPENMVDGSIKAITMQNIAMQRLLGSVCLKGRTLSRAAQALIQLLPAIPSKAG